MSDLLNPFTKLVQLVEKHGYKRPLFALAILAALIALPVYFGQRVFINKPAESVVSIQDIDSQIQ